ncbi:MAG: hypothetical protein JWP98_1215 [Edaphobacter sp.]|nr:hypothetical protein [Edaphobacter sp.]
MVGKRRCLLPDRCGPPRYGRSRGASSWFRHAWSVRIISADALLRLVQLKENADENTASKTRELLVPFEYTRLDKIIDLAFTAASEATAGISEDVLEVPTEETPLVGTEMKPITTQEHTPWDKQDRLRLAISSRLASELHFEIVKKSRAVYWSTDRQTRIVISLSKFYADGWYWYGYRPTWDKLLAEAQTGIFALGCVGANYFFSLPFDFIHGVLPDLNTTVYDEIAHWHIHLQEDQGVMRIKLHRTGEFKSIEGFKKSLVSPI